jgi:hypothetical protein
MLVYSSLKLRLGEAPGYPWSSWASGGYKPFGVGSEAARAWHDDIVKRIGEVR